MATLTVEGVPEALLARLCAAAAASGRCLGSELIVQLARTLPAPAGARAHGESRAGPGCPAPAGCGCGALAAAGRRGRLVGWGGPAG